MAKLKNEGSREPLVISRLKVIAALSTCGNVNAVNDLDFSNAADLYAYDTENKYTEWEEKTPLNPTKAFHLINKSNKDVVLLPLDNYIVKDTHLTIGGIADYALLTSDELLFVEFKTNATSTTKKALINNSKKAQKQLWHTYDSILKPKFVAQGVELESEVEIEFYIVFDSLLNVTGANAAFMNQMTKFEDMYGHLLFFSNERELISQINN